VEGASATMDLKKVARPRILVKMSVVSEEYKVRIAKVPSCQGDSGRLRKTEPYHGYYFKVLKGQRPAAPLGQLDYTIEGGVGSSLCSSGMFANRPASPAL
jgi:hypothetical protein